MARDWNAHNHPKFNRQLGKDPEQIVVRSWQRDLAHIERNQPA
jgi:hypothetical protein